MSGHEHDQVRVQSRRRCRVDVAVGRYEQDEAWPHRGGHRATAATGHQGSGPVARSRQLHGSRRWPALLAAREEPKEGRVTKSEIVEALRCAADMCWETIIPVRSACLMTGATMSEVVSA